MRVGSQSKGLWHPGRICYMLSRLRKVADQDLRVILKCTLDVSFYGLVFGESTRWPIFFLQKEVIRIISNGHYGQYLVHCRLLLKQLT